MNRTDRCTTAAATLALTWLLSLLSASAQTQPPTAPPGAWTMKAPLPVPRNEVALAAVGGMLYVVGGGIAGNAVPMIDEYNPAADTWRARAAMPRGLDHIGVAVLDGKIVTIGGFIGSVHRGAVDFSSIRSGDRPLAHAELLESASCLGRRCCPRWQDPRHWRSRSR